MRFDGKISGVGNSTTRKNEITADDLATLRHFQMGYDYGVINRKGYNFLIDYRIKSSSVEVGKGIMFAYGYLGFVDKTVLEFIRPSIPQYHIIYVELDRSRIPNACTLKVRNNQSIPLKIDNNENVKRTFRQDYLDMVRTGIFQLPLWQVKVGSNGIEEVSDMRTLRDKPMQVIYSPECKRVFGEIATSATATTQPITDKSDKIATSNFVHLLARKIIDTRPPDTITVKLVSANTSQGTIASEATNSTTLTFNKLNYFNPQSIVITASVGYRVRAIIPSDDNILVNRISGLTCDISLKRMIEMDNPRVTVSFAKV